MGWGGEMNEEELAELEAQLQWFARTKQIPVNIALMMVDESLLLIAEVRRLRVAGGFVSRQFAQEVALDMMEPPSGE